MQIPSKSMGHAMLECCATPEKVYYRYAKMYDSMTLCKQSKMYSVLMILKSKDMILKRFKRIVFTHVRMTHVRKGLHDQTEETKTGCCKIYSKKCTLHPLSSSLPNIYQKMAPKLLLAKRYISIWKATLSIYCVECCGTYSFWLIEHQHTENPICQIKFCFQPN